MIQFKMKALLLKKQTKEARKITMYELAEVTGISRVTLSKIMNHADCNVTTDNLDKLCKFFECRIEQLIEYVPESAVK